MLADTPKPPYYFVSFSSQLADTEGDLYSQMGDRMVELAKNQKGFLGVESTRNEAGFGITISYWKTKEDIKNWKLNAEHLVAQKLGKETFYRYYKTRVGLVERDYGKY